MTRAQAAAREIWSLDNGASNISMRITPNKRAHRCSLALQAVPAR